MTSGTGSYKSENPRGRPCPHGNRPAAACGRCKSAEAARVARELAAQGPLALDGERLLGAADGQDIADSLAADATRHLAETRGEVTRPGRPPRGEAPPPAAHEVGADDSSAASPDADAAGAGADAGSGVGGGIVPHDGGGVGSHVRRDVTPPLPSPRATSGAVALAAKALAGTGPIQQDEGAEDDEEPPADVGMPPEEMADGAAPKQRWGRDLKWWERLSDGYRLAIQRVGDDYQLVEMVREASITGQAVWRDRPLGEPDGFDVVEARLLDLAVEYMTP